MVHKKYNTEEEQEDARRRQNRYNQRAWRERKRRQRNAISSIDTDKRRATKRTRNQMVEQASDDVGRPESELALPEHLEFQLRRINGDVENIARISQSTTDRSVSEYVKEQGPCIQRIIDILQALQEDRSRSAEASVGDDQFQRGQHPTPSRPACSRMLPLNELLNPS
ncbi:hypothetical protein PMIN03_012756 [Paraphaeosphaeria minitans]